MFNIKEMSLENREYAHKKALEFFALFNRDSLLFKDEKEFVKKVEKAILFIIKKHEGQFRKSDEPYYTHPVAVAEILAGLKIDLKTILVALLHDTVEDTETTLEEITEEFDGEVATLVDGVTKLTRINFSSKNQKQAENFRKLLFAISEDLRVLLVKLADRLHNMRTLHYFTNEKKREEIATETLDIYAPMAERIGLQNFKDELQDLSFKNLNPKAHELVTARINYLYETDAKQVEEITNSLKLLLEASGVKEIKVSGRVKLPHSIWRKMQTQKVDFEELHDIVAFRIIALSEDDCYRALGAIHRKYHIVPGRFKDYISNPKENGYKSLHTIIIGPTHKAIEVQIRTEEMNQIAEFGVAAHWGYKQNVKSEKEVNRYRWVRELMNISSQSDGESLEFLENSKLAMYQDQVFCFTPKGDLISLPKGSTPVDFAFSVHSEVGRNCVGAKINGKIVSLRQVLNNGDQVEIIQSKAKTPSPSWQDYAFTGKARMEIRKQLRVEQNKEYIKLGKEILNNALLQQIENVEEMEKNKNFLEEFLKPLLYKYKKKTTEEFLVSLGKGEIKVKELIPENNYFIPDKSKGERLLGFLSLKRNSANRKFAIPIDGLKPGFAVHFSNCCFPLPYEDIIGVSTVGFGIYVHKKSCEFLDKTIKSEDLLPIKWQNNESNIIFLSRVILTVINEKGVLSQITGIISENDINITNVKLSTKDVDNAELVLDLEVKNINQLQQLKTRLMLERSVVGVERYQKKPLQKNQKIKRESESSVYEKKV